MSDLHDARVEAAAKAAYEYAQENATVPMPRREWESLGWIERGLFEGEARAALEAAARAAQGAAPPVNGFDTTAERVKTVADSLHVASQEPCPQPCEHLSAEDAREGRDCREHPCTCPTAPSSDREKLIEEARAVVPQAETSQCGPCRRGQHGCCDGNEYLRCDCGHVTPVLPSSGVDEDALVQRIYDELMTDDAVAEVWSNGKVLATARRLVKFAVQGGESRAE